MTTQEQIDQLQKQNEEIHVFMIGNCHQTKEENEEWYAKFGDAWEEKIK